MEEPRKDATNNMAIIVVGLLCTLTSFFFGYYFASFQMNTPEETVKQTIDIFLTGEWERQIDKTRKGFERAQAEMIADVLKQDTVLVNGLKENGIECIVK